MAMLVRDFGYVITQASAKKTSTTTAGQGRAQEPEARQGMGRRPRSMPNAQTIAIATAGDRNAQLNKSAYNIFQIVHGNPGLLDEKEVRRRLFAAAEACGLVDDDGADSCVAYH